MSNGPQDLKVGVREFERSISGLAQQIEGVADTASDILKEAKKTNGRVTAIEAALAEFERKGGVITMRDVWLVSITVGTTAGVTAAVVKWLPALLRAAGGITP